MSLVVPNRILLLLLVCFLLKAAASKNGANVESNTSGTVRFVTVARINGCSVSLYFHNDSKAFYLAPAYCIVQDTGSLLADVVAMRDNLLGGFYLNFPVVVTSDELLRDARRSLNSVILRGGGRLNGFLKPLSARDADGFGVTTVQLETGGEIGYLRVPCQRDSCYDLVSQLIGQRWYPIERIRLTSFVRLPSSQIVQLQHQVSFAHKSRILLRPSVEGEAYSPKCSSLNAFETIQLNDSHCHATVLQSSYRRAHYVVEPVLCYEGRYSTHLGYKGGIVALILETKTVQVLEVLRRKLPSALHVDLLNVVSAEVQVSSLLSSRWTVEPLRMEPDGSRAELRILSDTDASRERLLATLQHSPSDVWRHVGLQLESQLELTNYASCSWQSRATPFPAQKLTETASRGDLLNYHAIDGLLCVNSAYKLSLPLLSDSLCGTMCTGTDRCQAFSTASGSCELFLFDKCSLNVRNCGCSRRGRVFVRLRAGLAPGRLCPSGFGYDRCGVSYKITKQRGIGWLTAKQRSESQPGMVTMADVLDESELNHIVAVYRSQGVRSLWLGGSQQAGSSEPAGGWRWVSCDRRVDMGSHLWRRGEPNDFLHREEVMEIGRYGPKLNDMWTHDDEVDGFLSECVSPFE